MFGISIFHSIVYSPSPPRPHLLNTLAFAKWFTDILQLFSFKKGGNYFSFIRFGHYSSFDSHLSSLFIWVFFYISFFLEFVTDLKIILPENFSNYPLCSSYVTVARLFTVASLFWRERKNRNVWRIYFTLWMINIISTFLI